MLCEEVGTCTLNELQKDSTKLSSTRIFNCFGIVLGPVTTSVQLIVEAGQFIIAFGILVPFEKRVWSKHKAVQN
jgi:hypothetical protein